MEWGGEVLKLVPVRLQQQQEERRKRQCLPGHCVPNEQDELAGAQFERQGASSNLPGPGCGVQPEHLAHHLQFPIGLEAARMGERRHGLGPLGTGGKDAGGKRVEGEEARRFGRKKTTVKR